MSKVIKKRQRGNQEAIPLVDSGQGIRIGVFGREELGTFILLYSLSRKLGIIYQTKNKMAVTK